MIGPDPVFPPRLLSTASRFSGAWDNAVAAGTSTSAFASAAIVASVPQIIPLRVPWRYPVRRVFVMNGSAVAGNVDMAIYSATGSKLWSAGSTSQAGTNQTQYFTPSPDFILAPGVYWIGFVGNNNGGTVFRRAGSSLDVRTIPIHASGSTFPMPANLSAFVGATPQGTQVVLMGITMTASGF